MVNAANHLLLSGTKLLNFNQEFKLIDLSLGTIIFEIFNERIFVQPLEERSDLGLSGFRDVVGSELLHAKRQILELVICKVFRMPLEELPVVVCCDRELLSELSELIKHAVWTTPEHSLCFDFVEEINRHCSHPTL